MNYSFKTLHPNTTSCIVQPLSSSASNFFLNSGYTLIEKALYYWLLTQTVDNLFIVMSHVPIEECVLLEINVLIDLKAW